MAEPIKLLIVEDSESDALLLLRELRRQGLEPTSVRVDTPTAMAEALRERWDAIVSDYSMPQFTALDALRMAHEVDVDLPFIIVSGTVGEDVAVQAMKAGAHDYLMKGRLRRIGETIRRELQAADERRRGKQTGRKLEHLNRVLRAIRNVNQLIVREKDPEKLVEQACALLVETRGYHGAWIALAPDWGLPSRSAPVVALEGFGEAGAVFARRVAADRWPACGQALEAAAEGLIVREPRAECGDCPLAQQYGADASAVVALRHGSLAVGLLGVAFPAGMAVDDEERSLLHEVAGDLAFALNGIQLERQRSRYAQIVAASSEAMALISRSYTYLEANPSYAKLCRWSNGSIVGRSVGEVIGERLFAASVKPQLDRCLAGNEVRFETVRIGRGGIRHHLEALYTPCLAPDGSPYAVAATIRDVSEQRRIEERLRASEERYRALFEGSASALVTLEPPEWQLTTANPAALRLFAASERAELVGKALDELLPETQPNGRISSEEVRRAVDTAMRDGVCVADWEARRLGESEFPATVQLTRVEADGDPILHCNVRDLTETREMQMQIAQADRLASMGMLAAGVAHEIRNPLVYVLNNLESLAGDLPAVIAQARALCSRLAAELAPEVADRVKDDVGGSIAPAVIDDIRERFDDALVGARRIRDIARSLGTFSRVERDEPTQVDVRDAITVAVDMAHNEIKYRARLVKELGEVPPVLGSEGRLSQVFLNLLINATHAIDEAAGKPGEIRVRTWLEGPDVCAEVRDTGKGIAPEHLDKLFAPFFTTKRIGVGSGLGLAISSNIIASYGGRIDVSSELGKGACFVVRLPACTPESLVPTPRPSTDRASQVGRRGRILVVDDEPEVRSALRRILRAHEVVTAGSGNEARAILSEDENFDLVLCDVMMPDMTGIDVHEWLVDKSPKLAGRLVFMTGGAFTPRTREYLARVASERIEKPFDAPALDRLVADLVRRRRRSAT